MISTTFSSARHSSVGRVNVAVEELKKQIDELIVKITTTVEKLEIEIGVISDRLNLFDIRLNKESDIRAAQIKAIRLEISEKNKVAQEALTIATRALEFAMHHHHRYNTGLDWHTTKGYEVNHSLGLYDY